MGAPHARGDLCDRLGRDGTALSSPEHGADLSGVESQLDQRFIGIQRILDEELPPATQPLRERCPHPFRVLLAPRS